MWFMNGTTVASTGGVGNIPTNWTVQSVNAEWSPPADAEDIRDFGLTRPRQQYRHILARGRLIYRFANFLQVAAVPAPAELQTS
jgi:hypothetical protein